jgi:NAD(P)-dependent dehydrogenase (short-subunit alcohol dehydrogenase family)
MNKTVLITGSAKRIGRGLIKGFASKGWDVIIHYNTSGKEAEELAKEVDSENVKVGVYQADLRDKEQISSMFEEISKKYNKIDVLINNAAIFPKPINFKDLDDDIWYNTQNSNLNSVYHVTKEYTKHYDEGRIINFASLGAYEVWSGRSHYHAAKSGVLHFTRALGKDLAPNYSVNSISPGVIEIPGDDTDDKSIAFEKRIPMGRFGNTDDIFDAAYFFATASKYITCQDLMVDGGWHYTR